MSPEPCKTLPTGSYHHVDNVPSPSSWDVNSSERNGKVLKHSTRDVSAVGVFVRLLLGRLQKDRGPLQSRRSCPRSSGSSQVSCEIGGTFSHHHHQTIMPLPSVVRMQPQRFCKCRVASWLGLRNVAAPSLLGGIADNE